MIVPTPPVLRKAIMPKGEMFDWFIQRMAGAGWENLASDPGAEAAVMHSKGEKRDTDIYVQLRPCWTTIGHPSNDTKGQREDGSAKIQAAADFRSSSNSHWSIRLFTSYSPGAPGAPGAYAPLGAHLRTIHIFRGGLAPSTTNIEVYYYIDRDMCILIARPPAGFPIADYAGSFLIFGMPKDGIGSPHSPNDSFYCTVPITSYTTSQTLQYNVATPPADKVITAGGAIGAASAMVENDCTHCAPMGHYDWKNRLVMGVGQYGGAAGGARGLITGVYVLPAAVYGSIVDGDYINDQGAGFLYKAFRMPKPTWGQFGLAGDWLFAARVA